ncbi:MAG: TldD/PmbA family protein [Candidatus Heimdallarchaeota archaeon]|nr:TldD/PmbA family protein [Candidatus Heimdallarchaeota archaeon]
MFDQAIDLGHQIIKSNINKGIKEIEIFYAYSNQKQITINGTSLSTQRIKEELGAGIRVINNESVGFSFTNIITREALQKTIEEAFAIAKSSPKIEGSGLAKKQKYKQIEGIFNKDLVNLPVEKITQDALDYIDGFTSIDPRVSTVLSSINLNVNGKALINTNGVEAITKNAYYSANLLALASENGKSGAYTFDSVFSRDHNVNLKEIGEKLGKEAIDNLNQETISSFDGEVIFKENAMYNPIAVVVCLATSADWRQKGISFWKDKLADTVAIESFNLVNSPFDLNSGRGIMPFDDEANAAKDIEIVKEGILQTFLHNQRTANIENLEPTGTTLRIGGGPSFTQIPEQIFPLSPCILAGDMSEDELIAETRKGIIINNFAGTVRDQSGVFSGVAKGAYLIEDGEIVKPITGVSISGNVFDIINQITGIGKKYHLANNLLKTPIMKFEGIKISTK